MRTVDETIDQSLLLSILAESYAGPAWHGPDTSESAWLVDRDLLDDYQERLLDAIRGATAEQLARVPERSGVSVARQLLGMALHDTYHAGQIKLIALAAGV